MPDYMTNSLCLACDPDLRPLQDAENSIFQVQHYRYYHVIDAINTTTTDCQYSLSQYTIYIITYMGYMGRDMSSSPV